MLVKVPKVTLRFWCGSLPHNSQKGTTFILNSNCEFLLAASVQKAVSTPRIHNKHKENFVISQPIGII